MRVLFDTNVVLDLLLERAPYVEEAQILFEYVERGEITGMLGATTVTTIHYLASKALGEKEARGVLTTLLNLFDIAGVTRVVLQEALDSGNRDYEDAVLIAASVHAGVDVIVTRDAKGFDKAAVAVMTPGEFLASLETL